MSLELYLRFAGLLQIALAAAHIPFPRLFNWKVELARLSLLNRQIFIVHTLFIVLVLLLIGALSLVAPTSLTEPTRLGLFIGAGLFVFWLARLFVQFFVYDPALWRGDRTRTVAHITVSIVWLYLALVYGAVVVTQYIVRK
jgi:hypothetical protein